MIVHVWQNESIDKWYRPSKKDKVASGKLYNRYTNISKKIKKAVYELDKKETENIEKQKIEKEERYVNELACISLNEIERIIFLWEKTLKSRQSTCSIDEYFDKYPQLQPPLGIHLIELDYKLLNLSEANILHKKWSIVYPKILKLAKRQKGKEQLFENCENVPPEVLAWRVFPYLFKPVLMKTSIKKIPWKPSTEEQSNGFITWINVSLTFHDTSRICASFCFIFKLNLIFYI